MSTAAPPPAAPAAAPANLATIRAAIKDTGYLHIPGGRRDRTTPAETIHLHGID